MESQPGISQALPPCAFPFADVTSHHVPAPNVLCETTYRALRVHWKNTTPRGAGGGVLGTQNIWCQRWDSLACPWLSEIQCKLVLKGRRRGRCQTSTSGRLLNHSRHERAALLSTERQTFPMQFNNHRSRPRREDPLGPWMVLSGSANAGRKKLSPVKPLGFMLSSGSGERDLTHSKGEPGLPNGFTFVLLSPLHGKNKG